MTQTPTDEFITLKEAAEWLKVSESWIYASVHRREIPFMRIGGQLRFSPDEIRAWMKEQGNR